MTFADDFVALHFEHKTILQPCAAIGLQWPPPEEIEVFGFPFRRERYSSITDEQREQMTHVCRGAEYFVRESHE